MMTNTSTSRPGKIDVGGVELEYEAHGQGDPVLFIHGAIVAQAFGPLMEQPVLADNYCLVSYHRRGSPAAPGPLSP